MTRVRALVAFTAAITSCTFPGPMYVLVCGVYRRCTQLAITCNPAVPTSSLNSLKDSFKENIGPLLPTPCLSMLCAARRSSSFVSTATKMHFSFSTPTILGS